jgi:hypothetical protein
MYGKKHARRQHQQLVGDDQQPDLHDKGSTQYSLFRLLLTKFHHHHHQYQLVMPALLPATQRGSVPAAPAEMCGTCMNHLCASSTHAQATLAIELPQVHAASEDTKALMSRVQT